MSAAVKAICGLLRIDIYPVKEICCSASSEMYLLSSKARETME